jgi:hypothetical protein
MKKYLFIFNGTVVLNAASYDEAENLIEDLKVDDYVIDEDLFETDEHCISPNIKIRKSQLGTIHHPMDNPDEFEQFKIFECQYNSIFQDFLNGVLNKEELIDKISNVNDREIPDDCDLFASLKMIELDTRTMKTVRLCTVD